MRKNYQGFGWNLPRAYRRNGDTAVAPAALRLFAAKTGLEIRGLILTIFKLTRHLPHSELASAAVARPNPKSSTQTPKNYGRRRQTSQTSPENAEGDRDPSSPARGEGNRRHQRRRRGENQGHWRRQIPLPRTRSRVPEGRPEARRGHFAGRNPGCRQAGEGLQRRRDAECHLGLPDAGNVLIADRGL